MDKTLMKVELKFESFPMVTFSNVKDYEFIEGGVKLLRQNSDGSIDMVIFKKFISFEVKGVA